MAGVIYKIENPKGRVYIGQTVDFDSRVGRYRNMHCQGQPRLFNSLKRYGFCAHKVEVIEKVSDERDLNERESYWQVKYDVLSKNGMNCKIQGSQGRSGKLSDDLKKKIAESQTGKKHTLETKEKMRAAKLGVKMPREQRAKMLGVKHQPDRVEKARIRMIGNSYTKGITPVNAKKVIDQVTGKVYSSATEAAKAVGMRRTTLTEKLRGKNNNDTTLRYL